MNYPIDISDVVLENDKILLRLFNKSDLDDFYEYAKVFGVGELAGWSSHKNKNETLSILKLFIKEKKVFAIVLKENNKVIGSLGIERYNISDLDDSFNKNYLGREIGYVLNKDCWNQGIVSSALNLVIDYLFNDLKLDFLIIRYLKSNIASKKVAKKANFKYLKDIKIKNVNNENEEGELTILLNHSLLNKEIKIV